MKKQEYDPTEIDYSLREIVNNVCARIDQFYYGLFDELNKDEKEEFVNDLKKQSDKLYTSINEAIVKKANDINNLVMIITKINNELNQKNNQLIETQNFKDFLFNIIVHDMKNPIASILSYLNILLTQDSFKKKDIYDGLSNIKQSAFFLQDMILDILDISKIESKTFKPNLSIFSFKSLLLKCLESFKSNIKIKNIEIRYDFLFDEDIYLDESLLGRVLNNILSNAFRYVPRNGIISFKTYLKKRKVYIEICNNGGPIPDDVKDKIFDKYFSLTSESKYYTGTGLGLAFCKLAIEACKGKIKALSPCHDNIGTKFIIEFSQKNIIKKGN